MPSLELFLLLSEIFCATIPLYIVLSFVQFSLKGHALQTYGNVFLDLQSQIGVLLHFAQSDSHLHDSGFIM